MLIRPAIPDDAAAWSRVRHAAVPYLVASYDSALADLTRGRRLATAVAVDDAADAERPGEVVGICRLDPHGPDGTIWMMLMVDPAARRRGAPTVRWQRWRSSMSRASGRGTRTPARAPITGAAAWPRP